MIDDLDEVLREILIKEVPIKNGEIEIEFDQPKREWSSRLNRPTINIFLYDVKENTKLRSRDRTVVNRNQGNATEVQAPIWLDLKYMITAWATEAEDEHRLLSLVLVTFMRTPSIPREMLPDSLKNVPAIIPILVAQPGSLQNITDIWSVLDNEMKPAIPCDITLPIQPTDPIVGPLVRTRDLRISQAASTEPLATLNGDYQPGPPIKIEEAGEAQYWTIGGSIQSKRKIADMKMSLVEKGIGIPLEGDGRFTIGNLKAGDYTLEVIVKGRKTPSVHKITVPSPDYELSV